MSVINQVLNQLEERGAYGAAEQPMVRAVLRGRRDFIRPLLVIGLVLIIGIATWQWQASRKPDVAMEGIAAKMDNSLSSGVIGKSGEPEKLSAQQQSIVTATVPTPGISVANPPTDVLAPASRLSFELSSMPLPASLRPHDSSPRPRTGSTQDRPRQGRVQNSAANNHAANSGTASKPAQTAANTKAAASASAVPMKKISAAQQADAEFRRAVGLMQMGRIADAIAGYEAALRLDVGHDAARQALVALLLEGKRNADAEKVLLAGLNSKPENTGLTMLLARLLVERGALEQAILTLEKSLPFANEQADYRAFLAALLQRQNRNEEAITHYQIVIQHAPGNGVWLMGYAISLQALRRNADAKVAFQRALDTQTLSPELQAFVQQKLKEL